MMSGIQKSKINFGFGGELYMLSFVCSDDNGTTFITFWPMDILGLIGLV
jgi:hypothetical protein